MAIIPFRIGGLTQLLDPACFRLKLIGRRGCAGRQRRPPMLATSAGSSPTSLSSTNPNAKAAPSSGPIHHQPHRRRLHLPCRQASPAAAEDLYEAARRRHGALAQARSTVSPVPKSRAAAPRRPPARSCGTCMRAPATSRATSRQPKPVTSSRERKKVEVLFAHLRQILRLDRLRLRGPNGARDEVLLAATAQNLRKMAKLHSTNPLERLYGEIKRGTEVVGTIPTRRPSPARSARCCSNRTTSRLCSAPAP